MANEILCVGDVLWDVFPHGRHLGGAAFNVACHLRALNHPVQFAGCVGDDALGRETLADMRRRGLSADLMQIDAGQPTGTVDVDLSNPQQPRYTINQPAAWDYLRPSDALKNAADSSAAIVYGTIIQRQEPSRSTVRSLLRGPALAVYDINLRPPFDVPDVIDASLGLAEVLKLNDHELTILSQRYGLPRDLRGATEALSKHFDLQTICVTRGADGAALLHDGGWYEHAGFKVDVVNTVGAGDASLAALLSKLLNGADPADALRYANAVGAFVATKDSATPALENDAIEKLLRNSSA
jgi:fructokinase